MHSVSRTSPLIARCSDELVRWLLAAGVDELFGIPGGAISPLYDALARSTARMVMTQHESMAVYAAMGRHHATGRLQAVAVTSGPGLLNTLTAVAAARADEIPLLVLAGEVRTGWSGRGALQDGGPAGLDVATMFAPVVRGVFTLDAAGDLPALLDAARVAATRHPRGPVLVRLPVDVAGSPFSPAEARAGEPPAPPAPLAPPSDALAAIAAELRGARRPVLFAGVGARSAGVGDELTALAYRLRAPVITDLEAKGLVDEREPLSLGAYGIGSTGAAQRWLESGVDVLLTIGARLDDTATAGFAAGLRAPRLLQLDHDPARLGRPWTPDVAVHCDLRAALVALRNAVGTLPVAEVLRRDAELRSLRDRPEELPVFDAAPFHPAAAVRALQDAFGPRARFTSDIGNHLLFAGRWLEASGPDTLRVSIGLGGMGSGIGLAMGLATASRGRGDASVVGICGDGGVLMVGNELATCARYRIPAVFAVFDNRGFGMIAHGMKRVYGEASFCDVPEVDLVQYARSLGVRAVDVRSSADLREAAAVAGDGPLLLRIPVDPDVELVNPRDAGFLRAEVSRS
jgi:acetolactate synthase-1/2/3 large subunit